MRRHDGQVGGTPLVENRPGGRFARTQFAKTMTVGGGAGQSLVERHAGRQGVLSGGRCRRGQQQHAGKNQVTHARELQTVGR